MNQLQLDRGMDVRALGDIGHETDADLNTPSPMKLHELLMADTC